MEWIMLPIQFETHRTEIFHCDYCKQDFPARVVTWVDASRRPGVKTLLRQWEFNTVTCPGCGNKNCADTPFFYEDFEEGLLAAVFPKIPENRLSVEEQIRRRYGCYPTLVFFYDMTQLWFLICLQEHYKERANQRLSSNLGSGEERLRNFLRFLKKDPLMLAIRETLSKTLSGNQTNDELQDILWRAFAKIEGTSFAPLDASSQPGAPAL
jgi:CpXC protein